MAADTLLPPDPEQVLDDCRRALAEDLGAGDLTAQLVPDDHAQAELWLKEPALLAGRDWFETCFRLLDPDAEIDWLSPEGAWLAQPVRICAIRARARALLSAERSAINFLQTLSATATQTRAHVLAVAHTRARILDTRKTLPGLRYAQKYAVRVGGGHNHRIGLFDAVLIKENHIAACGSILAAVQRARSLFPGILVEVEVENFEELREALAVGPDRIMLDEFELADLPAAVTLAAGRCPLEVSGGVQGERLVAIAESGVDFISIGALTKHVRAIDFSLRVRRG